MHEIYQQKDLPYLNVQVCPNCNQLVPLNLKVCPRCGHSMVEEKKENVAIDEFATQTVEMASPTVTSTIEETKKPLEEIKKEEVQNEDLSSKKEKKPSLFLRQIFNLTTIFSLIFAFCLLLWSNYFSLNALGLDQTMYSISYNGIDILTFQKDAAVLSNGIQQISIFSSSTTYQQIGTILLFAIYAIFVLLLIIGIIASFIHLCQRKKPITKLYGFILIPSGILWIASFIHSLLFEKTTFMKENQFQVSISSIYIFLLLFIIWIMITFIFLKDDGRKMERKKKIKKEETKKPLEEDELFKD